MFAKNAGLNLVDRTGLQDIAELHTGCLQLKVEPEENELEREEDEEQSATVQLQQLCRMCAQPCSVATSSSLLDPSANNALCSVLLQYFCINVVASDGLPTRLCVSCGRELQHWEQVKSSVAQAQHFLRQQLELQSTKDLTSLDPDPATIEPKIENIAPSETLSQFESVNVGQKLELQDTHGVRNQGLSDKDPLTQNTELPSADDCNSHILVTQSQVLPNFSDNNNRLPSQNNPFECVFCSLMFNNSQSIFEHIQAHLSADNLIIKIPCPRCKLVFNNAKTHVKHLELHVKYPNREYGFSCDECGKLFHRPSHLTYHMKVHKNILIENVKCSLCDATFKHNSLLDVHLKKHNSGLIGSNVISNDNSTANSTQETEKNNVATLPEIVNYFISVPDTANVQPILYQGQNFVPQNALLGNLSIQGQNFLTQTSLVQNSLYQGQNFVPQACIVQNPLYQGQNLVHHNSLVQTSIFQGQNFVPQTGLVHSSLYQGQNFVTDNSLVSNLLYQGLSSKPQTAFILNPSIQAQNIEPDVAVIQNTPRQEQNLLPVQKVTTASINPSQICIEPAPINDARPVEQSCLELPKASKLPCKVRRRKDPPTPKDPLNLDDPLTLEDPPTPSLVCKLCAEHTKFESSIALNLHIKSKHVAMQNYSHVAMQNDFPTFSKNKVGVFNCSQCNSNFRLGVTLRSHLIRKHGLPSPHKCELCGKMFPNHTSLKNHAAIHSSYKEFQCQICNHKVRTKWSLILHIEVNHPKSGSSEKIECIVCKKTFTSPILHRYHLFQKHRPKIISPTKHTCKLCGEGFSSHYLRQSHTYTVHTRKPEYHCDKCKKLFNSKTSIYSHMVVHLNIRPHKCDVCKKSFTTNLLLIAHKRVHTGEKPFECRICHQRFNQHSIMFRHMRSHGNATMYACDICDKQIRTKADLMKHRKVVHDLM